jgi:hypothetical protein
MLKLSIPARHSARAAALLLATLAVAVLPAAALSAKPPATSKSKPAAHRLSLTASSVQPVFGGTTILSGTLSTRQAGVSVAILAERYGSTHFSALATVATSAGGTWRYAARPTIRTIYMGRWKSTTSHAVTVGVHPHGSFDALSKGRLSTRILAAHSFAGRLVELQRRSLGRWTTIGRMRLNGNSTSVFRPALPSGSSTLRVAMSVNQAGVGYLGAFSRTLVLHHS